MLLPLTCRCRAACPQHGWRHDSCCFLHISSHDADSALLTPFSCCDVTAAASAPCSAACPQVWSVTRPLLPWLHNRSQCRVCPSYILSPVLGHCCCCFCTLQRRLPSGMVGDMTAAAIVTHRVMMPSLPFLLPFCCGMSLLLRLHLAALPAIRHGRRQGSCCHGHKTCQTGHNTVSFPW
jgi:hypothetical protein